MTATLKTLTLFALLTLLAATVGFVVGGGLGVLLGATSVVLLAGAGSQVSEPMLMRLLGGAPLHPLRAPELYRRVAQLSARAGIAMPSVYFAPTPSANAMAVRTNGRGALLLTAGATRALPPVELEAVLAHEIAHLKNGDTEVLQLSGVVAQAALTMLRVGTWLAVIGVLLTGGGMARAALLTMLALVVPPLVGALRSALSRTRELAADADAARLTGDPLALARALSRLDQYHRRHGGVAAVRRLPEWLSSHPPTEERVRKLLDLAGRSGMSTPSTRFDRMSWAGSP